jgi:mRNA interferase RelE/StbE
MLAGGYPWMNSEEKFKVVLDKQTIKYLKKLDSKQKNRILNILTEIAVNPFAGDIETIKGKPGYYRRRIGSYRLKFRVMLKEKEIRVLDFGPKGDFEY